jgi:hypothetical protein
MPGIEQNVQLKLIPNSAGVIEGAQWPTFNHDTMLSCDILVKVLIEHSVCIAL